MITISSAELKDATKISELICTLIPYLQLDLSLKGAEYFLQSVTTESIANYIAAENFLYLVAHVNAQLVGVVAIRDNTHLYHLFVDSAFQRQGIATRLWLEAKNRVLATGNIQIMTVNASLYAVPVYERFGFVALRDKIEKNGLVFVPMQLNLTQQLKAV